MASGSSRDRYGEVEECDFLIVGSGFGGSVMAARLAEKSQESVKGWRVLLLERGKRYPPGSFPRSPYAMARNTWDPSEGFYGLFDLWSFPGLSSIVSSGLGGGSLIYSNVMLRKPATWFVNERMPGGGYESWPITREMLDPHYLRVEQSLKVASYPLQFEPYAGTGRTHAVLKAGVAVGQTPFLPNLAVTFGNDPDAPVPGEQIVEAIPNLHGKPRSTCHLVAECNFGCNFGSKNSLDHTYLSRAEHAGAELRDLCEVRRFWPDGNRGFFVEYVHHDTSTTSKDPSLRPKVVHCKRLVLAAGTFGSTYLLLKNRGTLPFISKRLGTRFSANGDFLGLALRVREHGQPKQMQPSFGAAITATYQVPRVEGSESHRGAWVQDAGYPDAISWILQESLPLLTPRLLRFLVGEIGASLAGHRRAIMNAALRTILGKAEVTATSMSIAAFGRDVPDSTFDLDKDDLLDLDWKVRNSRPYFDHVDHVLHEFGDAIGATLVTTLRQLNRIVTVHPLGGVPMAWDSDHGVVNDYGEVFCHERLVVADGSVMPGPVGSNPSLTIAAFADRAADRLIDVGP